MHVVLLNDSNLSPAVSLNSGKVLEVKIVLAPAVKHVISSLNAIEFRGHDLLYLHTYT